MSDFTLTVDDQAVRDALKALAGRVQNMQPVLQAIGEDVVERAKHRFETSTGPDGAKWQANSAATLAMLAARIAGKSSYRNKRGALNKKGLAVLGNKKPLIGESGFLRQQIVAVASAHSVNINAGAAYAAIQQFGGTTSPKSMIPGAKIPARPFLPVRIDGTLYPAEQALILQSLNDYFMDRL